MKSGTLLIGMGARIHRSAKGDLWIENQTVSGLKGWKRGFDRVVGYAIESEKPIPNGWVPAIESGIAEPDFRLVALPDTYRSGWFSNEFRAARYRLLTEMRAADFCVFSYGGWIGDPGEIAASTARRYGIKHAVFLDRVESQVIRKSRSSKSLPKRWLASQITAFNENRAVRKAPLALLHGQTVYQYFKKIASNPHIVENIHYDRHDRIDEYSLTAKLQSCRQDPLKIVYVGRAEPMKGGRNWVQVLNKLREKGVVFEACWYGDGSELTAMRQMAQQMGLSEKELHFAGFVADREAIKAAYRHAHLFVFCHMTDESPRNLIESLHAATPLIGFEDPFSRSLVDEKAAGVLVERGNIDQLAAIIAAIAGDRDRLADLVERAARSASHLTRDEVFDERIAIVKRELG